MSTLPRRQVFLRIALVVLVLDGAAWMGWEFWRLLWQPEPMGAVDLRLRYLEVLRWFAGFPVYSQREFVPSVYPPATFAMLWPLLGWLSFSAARWFWAVTSIGAILATMLGFTQGSMAASKVERGLIAALVVATYPVGATLGNGQLTIHVMACALWSVLWLARHGTGLQRYFVVPLAVFSMVKPSSAIPFLVVALFLPGGVLPLLVAAAVYLGLTFFAAAFQPTDLIALTREMGARSNRLALFTGTPFYANLHTWLTGLGIRQFLLTSSIVVLLLFAVWAYRHRKCDIWLLMGVAAIVTRMWTYHRWYDDELLLIPMVALFRLTGCGKKRNEGDRPLCPRAPFTANELVTGGDREVCPLHFAFFRNLLMKSTASASSSNVPALLFWAGLITMLAPGGLYLLPGPWPRMYTAWETFLWLTYLLFLAKACMQERALRL